ncbi:MAG: chemotaxis-specific protein-glutamate methyltransferase CheB [Aggregatilineales bacterium]
MSESVRVLIAEDSPTVRRYLRHLITEAPGMKVIGEANDGEEAVRMVQRLQPDVVSMDINMPVLDGLEATRQIMNFCPTPVVVVSGLLDIDIHLSMNALQAGALAVVGKPPDKRSPEFPARLQQLLTTLKAMSRVHVIARRDFQHIDEELYETHGTRPTWGSRPSRPSRPIRRTRPEVIAIGASTGGPGALHRILSTLPDNLAVPIVIVQHMPDDFITGMARWLNNNTNLSVSVARDGRILRPGMVAIAPGDMHLEVSRYGTEILLKLDKNPGTSRYQPSVDVLFDSIAKQCGSAAVGVLLTGMGDDGARGLLAMRRAGAYTLVQDEASCTVFGMPHAAIEMGAAEKVKALSNLPAELLKLL